MNDIYFLVESSHPVVVEFLISILFTVFVGFIFAEDAADVGEETAAWDYVVGFHPLNEDIPGGD